MAMAKNASGDWTAGLSSPDLLQKASARSLMPTACMLAAEGTTAHAPTSVPRSQIQNAKVLCVGAGGIGCELLKTLVCTGFKDIELVRA